LGVSAAARVAAGIFVGYDPVSWEIRGIPEILLQAESRRRPQDGRDTSSLRRMTQVTDTPPPRRRGRPPSASSEPGGEVQSLDRAMSILEVLAVADGLSLSEVARRTELPSSTAHRLLTTLHKRKLVGHDAESGLWTVGVGLFRVGSAYVRIRKLPEIGRPMIRALVEAVDETVNLSMLDGPDLVCVAQSESHAPVRAFIRIGRRQPIHASAAGKAILARLTPERRAERIESLALERLTEHTHRTKKALAADLAEVSARGFAVDDEEQTLGMRCVAAAVLDEWGEPVGAISISAPTVRMAPERLGVLGEGVRQAAAELTALYCGRKSEG
jgi:IclR family acetate operon transcriptional repressor